MSELYCIYQEGLGKDGQAYSGTANIKLREGFAVAAFATSELAGYFASVFNVKGRVVAVSALGSAGLPLRPKPPMPVPALKLVFPTKGVLSAWAEDRAGFETAPYVFEFKPGA